MRTGVTSIQKVQISIHQIRVPNSVVQSPDLGGALFCGLGSGFFAAMSFQHTELEEMLMHTVLSFHLSAADLLFPYQLS